MLPLGPNLGGNNNRKEVNKGVSVGKEYLTAKWANYIYRKVQLGSLINKNTMKEEIDQGIDKVDNKW